MTDYVTVNRPLTRLPLALVAGLLICFALPPWGWWPLAIIGIAVWVHLTGQTVSRWDRFLTSAVVAIAWFAPSTLWMFKLTAPGYVLGVPLGWGIMAGVAGMLIPADRRRYLALPAALVFFEWFHSHAPFGGVPLSMLSYTQGKGPLLDAARIGGTLFVGLLVSLLGVAFYLIVMTRTHHTVIVSSVILIAVVASVALGALLHQPPTGPTQRIALVQGGGEQGTRYSSSQVVPVFQAHLDATAQLTPEHNLDLVIWPENAINVDGQFENHAWRDVIAQEAARLNTQILVGVVEDVPEDPDAFANFVTTVNPDGSLGDRYDKVRRVPFGEYVPLRPLFELFAKDQLPGRDQVPGDGVALVQTDAGPAAVAISWEIFFSRRVREGVRESGEIVVNPTNGSSYWLTILQSQQLATSALRAVESGRYVLQVAPTGFTGVFDEHGTLHNRIGISEQGVIVADVPRSTTTTIAQRTGPAIPLAIAVIFGFFVMIMPGAEYESVKNHRKN